MRNSKVEDIIKALAKYDIYPMDVDTWASKEDAKREYNVELANINEVKDLDCLIITVAHNEFRSLSIDDIKNLWKQFR